MITDVIREAKSEHEIYFLLTAYLEAIHFSDKLQPQPDLADILPIASIEKVRDRFEHFISNWTGRRKSSITKPAWSSRRAC